MQCLDIDIYIMVAADFTSHIHTVFGRTYIPNAFGLIMIFMKLSDVDVLFSLHCYPSWQYHVLQLFYLSLDSSCAPKISSLSGSSRKDSCLLCSGWCNSWCRPRPEGWGWCRPDLECEKNPCSQLPLHLVSGFYWLFGQLFVSGFYWCTL